tara:strand:- start:44 stop:472 length:429 start_codon:yes stop_codon:yes gene_type:complete
MGMTKEQYKAYAKTERGIMRNRKKHWVEQGIKFDDELQFITIYYHYLATNTCDKCNCEFTEGNTKYRKCLDHNHNTGLFRNILCNNCNVNDKITNTSGIPNINFNKLKKTWRYKKSNNYKEHCRNFKTKEEAIEYKKQYESI